MIDASMAAPFPSRVPPSTSPTLSLVGGAEGGTYPTSPDAMRAARTSMQLYVQGRIAEALDAIIRGFRGDEQPEQLAALASALETDRAASVAAEKGVAAGVSDLFEQMLNRAHRQKESNKGRSSAHVILMLMKSIGAYTYEHCTRLVDLALDLAKEMGYEDDQLYREVEYGVTYKDIGEAAFFLTRQDDKQRQALAAFLAGLNLAQDALLHDIGKIAIPQDILNKPAPLTESEMKMMRMHPVWGYDILSKLDDMSHALPVVRHHHERWDGTGYPDRLAAEQIPLAARIVSVVDAFDAMTFDRPYRKAMTVAEARDQIALNAGTQFDPQVAAAFVKMLSPHLQIRA
jgi:HD-GYP domain-containing protein (c-di-GMP phosphodiesterase class II)